jgi:hypothetical protein
MVGEDPENFDQLLDQDTALLLLGSSPDCIDVETLEKRRHLIKSSVKLVLDPVLSLLSGGLIASRFDRSAPGATQIQATLHCPKPAHGDTGSGSDRLHMDLI